MVSQTVHGRIMESLMETLKGLKTNREIPEDVVLSGDVTLVGDGAVIDSRSLVELLISLEDFIEEEYGATFDWASDRAMSATHSPFRTARTLVDFAVQEAGL